MRVTNFLDKDKKEASRDTVTQHNNTENGSNNENGYKSPNLLATTDDNDNDDDDETVLENKKKSKPNKDDKGTIMQQLQEQEEISLRGTRKEAWWATCKFCNQFPCVWTQNAEAVVENDKVMNQVAVQPLLPHNFVCRQQAFMHIATLVWGKQGYAYCFDLDTCVVDGVRKQWPAAPNGNYKGNGVE
jgi:hypothetical protein